MAEVTVIAPNVVELVGSLSPQARAAPQAPPPPADPRNQATLKSRDPAGGKSRGLAANANRFSTAPRPEIRDRPSPEPRPATQPQQPPSRPSTAFLAQLLAQRSGGGSVAAKRFDAAIAAYNRAGASQPGTAPSGVAFLTRTVDLEI